MINKGFKLKVGDIKKLTELKNSQAYRSYINGIAHSPLYTGIIKEHLENVDVSPDIRRLKREGKISGSVSESELNEIFRDTLRKMAVNIVSDTIILKELEDINIDEVTHDIQTESDIVYLMGLAEEQYYEEAKTLVENGKISKNDLAFKGLMAYLAINGKIPQTRVSQKEETAPVIESIPTKTRKMSVLNLDSKNIDL